MQVGYKNQVNKGRLSSGREVGGRVYNLREAETSHKVKEVSIQRMSTSSKVNIKVTNNYKIREIGLIYIAEIKNYTIGQK